ncbi:hypothetical protein SAMN05216391_10947 [Lachnospiraceae bacterium KHCPX20]|nr:hypothetical protein SAMN05216391_10947 [Lachnospiraceae bacterium KHCPX20]
MSKICPITENVVLYLDCLECDEKKCRGASPPKKEKKAKRIIRSILGILLCLSLFTGCGAKAVLPDKNKGIYGKDPEFTEKMDRYLAMADQTISTPSGKLSLFELPEQIIACNVNRFNENTLLQECGYLKEENPENPNGLPSHYIHFSYAKDITEVERMCVGFLFQTEDVPQSSFMDKYGKIQKLYKAKQDTSYTGTISYPDKKTEQVTKYIIKERGKTISKKGKNKGFTCVYVAKYNDGYIFMESYNPIDRAYGSVFQKVADAAIRSVNSKVVDKELSDLTSKLQKQQLKAKQNKTILYQISKDGKPTREDGGLKEKERLKSSTALMETIISNMMFASIRERDKKTIDSVNKAQGIELNGMPEYQSYHQLKAPIKTELESILNLRHYNCSEDKKREKKGKIFYLYKYKSQTDKFDQIEQYLCNKNKNGKKVYKEAIKAYKKHGFAKDVKISKKERKQYIAKKNLVYSQRKGQNFNVTICVNKKTHTAWAIYYFPMSKENDKNKDYYWLEKNGKPEYSDGTEFSQVVVISGDIKNVIEHMKLIRFKYVHENEDDNF